MKPISLAVVSIDDCGVVTGVAGDVGQFGLALDHKGRPWEDAFRGWEMPFGHPKELVCLPCRTEGVAPDGRNVFVDFCGAPSADGSRGILAMIREQEEATLTPQQEQLCGLGELTATVAHEINNALTPLTGWLCLILEELPAGDPRRAKIELVAGEAERIGKITRNLLQVARGANETPHLLDMRALIDEVLTLVSHEMEISNIIVESDLAESLPAVQGSAGRLKQALLNLLINAQQAMPTGGRVRVRAAPDSTGRIVVAVEDSGTGIPADLQRRVFSPFFTTKRDGTGLGLSMTRRIIEDHGGTLDLQSEPGVGTSFTLKLPARSP